MDVPGDKTKLYAGFLFCFCLFILLRLVFVCLVSFCLCLLCFVFVCFVSFCLCFVLSLFVVSFCICCFVLTLLFRFVFVVSFSLCLFAIVAVVVWRPHCCERIYSGSVHLTVTIDMLLLLPLCNLSACFCMINSALAFFNKSKTNKQKKKKKRERFSINLNIINERRKRAGRP